MFESMLSFLGSNAMSEYHAERQFDREKQLMAMENRMNNANVLNAYTQQAQGMRMAGLNPALATGTPQAAQVSKGSTSAAPTSDLDPTKDLVAAQAENIRAQTEKTKAETEVIPTEGDKNIAQTALYGSQKTLTEAEQKKVDEEAKSIANTNKTYSDQNEQLKIIGSAVARDWQETDWYKRLPEQLKGFVDQLAAGTTDLTVGGLEAFDKAIQMAGNLDQKSKDSWTNSVAVSVAEKQLQADEVLAAIANIPEAEYRLKDNQANKTFEEVTKVQKEVQKIISDIGRNGVLNQKDEVTMNHLEKQIQHINKQIEQINENDIGILLKNGRYGKTAVLTAINNLAAIIHTVGMIAVPGAIKGIKGIFDVLKNSKEGSMIDLPGSRNFNNTMRDINNSGGSIRSPHADRNGAFPTSQSGGMPTIIRP